MGNPGAILVGAIGTAAGVATLTGAARGVWTGVTPVFSRSGTYTGEARGCWGRVVAACYLVFGALLLAFGLAILTGRVAL